MDVVDVCSEARKVDGCADIGSGTEGGAQCVKNVVHLLLGNYDSEGREITVFLGETLDTTLKILSLQTWWHRIGKDLVV